MEEENNKCIGKLTANHSFVPEPRKGERKTGCGVTSHTLAETDTRPTWAIKWFLKPPCGSGVQGIVTSGGKSARQFVERATHKDVERESSRTRSRRDRT